MLVSYSYTNEKIDFLIKQNKLLKEENTLLTKEVKLLKLQQKKEKEYFLYMLKTQRQSHQRTILYFLILMSFIMIISIILIKKHYKEKLYKKPQKKEYKEIPKSKLNLKQIDIFDIKEDTKQLIDTKSRIINNKFTKNDDDLFILALYYFLNNQLKLSIEYLNKIEKKEDSNIYILKGLILKKQKRFNEALEYFNKAIKLKKNYKIYLTLGLIYKIQKKYKSAINAYKDALKLNNKSASIYNNIGTLYQKIDQFQKAKEYFLKAIELEKNFIFYSNLAIINSKLGEYEEALKYYKEALKYKNDKNQKIYCDTTNLKENLKEIKRSIYNIPTNKYDKLLKLID